MLTFLVGSPARSICVFVIGIICMLKAHAGLGPLPTKFRRSDVAQGVLVVNLPENPQVLIASSDPLRRVSRKFDIARIVELPSYPRLKDSRRLDGGAIARQKHNRELVAREMRARVIGDSCGSVACVGNIKNDTAE